MLKSLELNARGTHMNEYDKSYENEYVPRNHTPSLGQTGGTESQDAQVGGGRKSNADINAKIKKMVLRKQKQNEKYLKEDNIRRLIQQYLLKNTNIQTGGAEGKEGDAEGIDDLNKRNANERALAVINFKKMVEKGQNIELHLNLRVGCRVRVKHQEQQDQRELQEQQEQQEQQERSEEGELGTYIRMTNKIPIGFFILMDNDDLVRILPENMIDNVQLVKEDEYPSSRPYDPSDDSRFPDSRYSDHAEKRASDAEKVARNLEEQVRDAEKRARDAEKRASDADDSLAEQQRIVIEGKKHAVICVKLQSLYGALTGIFDEASSHTDPNDSMNHWYKFPEDVVTMAWDHIQRHKDDVVDQRQRDNINPLATKLAGKLAWSVSGLRISHKSAADYLNPPYDDEDDEDDEEDDGYGRDPQEEADNWVLLSDEGLDDLLVYFESFHGY